MEKVKIIKIKEIKRYNPDSADIDGDYEAAQRDVVKEYIKQRFGEFNTCSIGSYTRLKLRACIKDFSAVKGFKFSYVNFITSKMDNQLEYTFRDFIHYGMKSVDVYDFIQANPELVHAVKYAMGQPKAASIHASGVLILPKQDEDGNEMNLFNSLPVHKIDDLLVSEIEGKYTDLMGFLKNDVLGLDQLDKFKNCLRLIKQHYNIEIDFDNLPLDDKATFKLFQKGYNEDVFQFNGHGLKNYSKKVKPDRFEDLIAMNSLWRPATMSVNAHIDFALMKHGKKEVEYDYGLEEVTKKTFGLMIYQETMMQAVVTLGNFTLLDANRMRTATKKFDKNTMASFEKQFITGAIENKCPPKEAKKIWDKIVKFSGYTFNKSHSAAYAKIAYQTQWLKANYPLEFWTTAISFATEEEIPAMIGEMEKLKQGISIKPPSINKSEINFQCDPTTKSIYWSIAKIKGLGAKTVQHIVEARKGKAFVDFRDFLARVPSKVNRGHIVKMIVSGCFDELQNIKQPAERLILLKDFLALKKMDLPEEYKTAEAKRNYWWIIQQKLLTGYGEIDFKGMLAQNKDSKKLLRLFATPDEFAKKKDYDMCLLAGQVTDMLEKRTKKGDPFLILTLQANNENYKILLWSDFVSEHVEFLEQSSGKMVFISGKVRFDQYNGANALHVCEESVLGFL